MATRRRTARSRPRRQDDAGGDRQITKAAENYLLSIYMVEEQGFQVTNANLVDQLKRTPASEGLGTSPPSVAGMLRRMEREGLIGFGENREIDLTPRGVALAESIVRRHRLAERMVVDLLGLELPKAHVEAHRLEHAISDIMEERIRETLGNPTTCPFGHPIPGSGYEARGSAAVTLDGAPAGVPLVVDRIPEEDQQLLEYLVGHNIVPGVTVELAEVAPYRGVLTLQVGDESAVLGLGVANRIWVVTK